MSFEMKVALAGKLLNIRDSNKNILDSARAAVIKANEKKPDVDPQIINLQRDTAVVKGIKTGSKQNVPAEVANLMGVKITRPLTGKRPLPRLFK